MKQLFEVFDSVTEEYLIRCDQFNGEMTPDDLEIIIRNSIAQVVLPAQDWIIMPMKDYVSMYDRMTDKTKIARPKVVVKHNPDKSNHDPTHIIVETTDDVDIVMRDYSKGRDCEGCGAFCDRDDLLGFQMDVPGFGVLSASLCGKCAPKSMEFLTEKYEKKKGKA